MPETLLHPYDDTAFQAGRLLINMPGKWAECTPGQRNLFREAFQTHTLDQLEELIGGDVAERVLAFQTDYLRRLRSVAA